MPAQEPLDATGGTLFTEVSLGYLVNRLAREFVAAVQQRLAPHGVQPGQLPTLLQLYEREGRTQSELARTVGVEQPTMASTLRRMERDGLVERTPDPDDGRRALVGLTASARAREAAIRAELDQVNAVATAGLDDAEVQALVRTLDAITASLAALHEQDP
ncbi:MAG: winged helix-turn-helix transcriptional regulator [Nitriliruptoraceae bacterium]|nr:winged helix-turn-helix transcriptional regulator [Nitriliruptoraceae bacterium]